MQAGKTRQPAAALAPAGVDLDAPLVDDLGLTPEPAPPVDPLVRVAAALDPGELQALADFLEAHGTGVFRIDRVDGRVTAAHTDARLSRTLSSRSG